MDYRFNQAMSFRVEQILKTSDFFLAKSMRDLDCRPARIQRTIKTIHAEQEHLLDPDLEIEATADYPPLPQRSKNEVYPALVSEERAAAMASP